MGKLRFSPAKEMDVNVDMKLHEEEMALFGPDQACLDTLLYNSTVLQAAVNLI